MENITGNSVSEERHKSSDLRVSSWQSINSSNDVSYSILIDFCASLLDKKVDDNIDNTKVSVTESDQELVLYRDTYSEPLPENLCLRKNEPITNFSRSPEILNSEPLLENLCPKKNEPVTNCSRSLEILHSEPLPENLCLKKNEPIINCSRSLEILHFEPLAENLCLKKNEPITNCSRSPEMLHSEPLPENLCLKNNEPFTNSSRSPKILHSEPLPENLCLKNNEPITNCSRSPEILPENLCLKKNEPVTNCSQSPEILPENLCLKKSEPDTNCSRFPEILHSEPLQENLCLKRNEPITNCSRSTEILYSERLQENLCFKNNEPITDCSRSLEILHSEPLQENLCFKNNAPVTNSNDILNSVGSPSGPPIVNKKRRIIHIVDPFFFRRTKTQKRRLSLGYSVLQRRLARGHFFSSEVNLSVRRVPRRTSFLKTFHLSLLHLSPEIMLPVIPSKDTAWNLHISRLFSMGLDSLNTPSRCRSRNISRYPKKLISRYPKRLEISYRRTIKSYSINHLNKPNNCGKSLRAGEPAVSSMLPEAHVDNKEQALCVVSYDSSVMTNGSSFIPPLEVTSSVNKTKTYGTLTQSQLIKRKLFQMVLYQSRTSEIRPFIEGTHKLSSYKIFKLCQSFSITQEMKFMQIPLWESTFKCHISRLLTKKYGCANPIPPWGNQNILRYLKKFESSYMRSKKASSRNMLDKFNNSENIAKERLIVSRTLFSKRSSIPAVTETPCKSLSTDILCTNVVIEGFSNSAAENQIESKKLCALQVRDPRVKKRLEDTEIHPSSEQEFLNSEKIAENVVKEKESKQNTIPREDISETEQPVLRRSKRSVKARDRFKDVYDFTIGQNRSLKLKDKSFCSNAEQLTLKDLKNKSYRFNNNNPEILVNDSNKGNPQIASESKNSIYLTKQKERIKCKVQKSVIEKRDDLNEKTLCTDSGETITSPGSETNQVNVQLESDSTQSYLSCFQILVETNSFCADNVDDTVEEGAFEVTTPSCSLYVDKKLMTDNLQSGIINPTWREVEVFKCDSLEDESTNAIECYSNTATSKPKAGKKYISRKRKALATTQKNIKHKKNDPIDFNEITPWEEEKKLNNSHKGIQIHHPVREEPDITEWTKFSVEVDIHPPPKT